MRRDWTAARAKCDQEGRCRVCGKRHVRLEAAHTIGRVRDRRSKEGATVVAPVDIVPLCGDCHGAYDRHELDLLPYLTVDEQVAAVRAAGGIEKARRRLTGERLA